MTFDEARKKALAYSKKHKCTAHVNGKIVLIEDRNHGNCVAIDPEAWEVSDWYVSGSTVMTFVEDEDDEA